MTSGRYQHLAPPSKVAKVNRLRFFGHILRRPADRLVQRVLRSSSEYGIATNGLILCKLSQKIEKVRQSCVQGRHILAKMRVIASGDDISPPIKSRLVVFNGAPFAQIFAIQLFLRRPSGFS
ncbi:hypothetical protein RB195_021729 [Necator americanus]|uniref:Uncharacterized protein n=1 Tax=Necator americanus TaxID=51031 RepID=A0ABR1EEJ5_NECAM